MGAVNDYMKLASEVAKYNSRFAEDICAEIVNLINEILDALTPILKDKESYVKSVFSNTVIHIVMPLSYGIFNDFLLGNLPACFMQLRTMLEALVKAFYADMIPGEFFEDKMKILEKELKERNISISKVLKSLKKYSPEASHIALKIWGKCSEEWIHPRGFLEKLVKIVIEHQKLPAYSLVVPMNYGKEDHEPLSDLKNLIIDFTKLFGMLMDMHRDYKSSEVKK